MNDGEFFLSVLAMFEEEKGYWLDLLDSKQLEKKCIFKCFISEKSNKIYFFYWDNNGAEEQLSIVDTLIENMENLDFLPQDSYLIMFTNIETTTDSKYKEIILVEENEFRYKKYVCYYTKEEIANLRGNIDQIVVSDLWSDSDLLLKNEAYSLLYRIIIKVPIIKMNFQKKELEDFDSIYKEIRESGKRITNKFTSDEIISMENILLPYVPEEEDKIKDQAEDFVKNLIGKVYGDGLDEYLSE